MNRVGAVSLKYASEDKAQIEYLNGVSVKNCCTQEEISELDRLYQDYRKAEEAFYKYRNHLTERTYTRGLISTDGCIYTIK